MQDFDRITGIISQKDLESRVIQCNSVFLAYAGVNSDEKILGFTDYDFPWQEYAPIYRKHELDVLNGENYSMIFPLKDTTGAQRLFLHNKIGKYNDQQQIGGVLCHAIEIINPDMHRLFTHWHDSAPAEHNALFINKSHPNVDLTRREHDVLFFLLKGKTAKAIGMALNISPKTVRCHIERIKIKLHCHTKDELIDKAIALGIDQQLPTQLSMKKLLTTLQR